MTNWFKTRRQASVKLKRGQKENVWYCPDEVWGWAHTKRKKPFFVGSYFEWINQ